MVAGGQGVAGGAPAALLATREEAVVAGTRPDLTLILDLPVEQGLARAESRGGGEARFEQKGLEFHARLRQAFLRIAEADPDRCVVLDATLTVDAVAERVWDTVAGRLLGGQA